MVVPVPAACMCEALRCPQRRHVLRDSFSTPREPWEQWEAW
jgi:hypothetical protein